MNYLRAPRPSAHRRDDRRRSDAGAEPSPEEIERLAMLEQRVTEAEARLGSEGLEYLTGRGLTVETIERMRIGVLPCGAYLLPVLDEGRPIYAIEHHPGGDPKYLFPAGEVRLLLGAENLTGNGPVYVVEGWFDWAVMEQSGIPAIALLGTPSRAQLEQLREASDLILLFDGDDAGRAFADRIAAELYPRARIADPPDGMDPNDLAVERGDGFTEYVRKLAEEAEDPFDRGIARYAESGSPEDLRPLIVLAARLTEDSFEEDITVRRVLDASKDRGIRVPTVRAEIARARSELQRRDHVVRAEAAGPLEQEKKIDPEIERAAEELLEEPNLLDVMVRQTSGLGYCGEDVNRKVMLLAGVAGHTARSHTEAIHVVIRGDSSAGKNELTRAGLGLLPENRVRYLTGVSKLALNYLGDRVEGVLVFSEAEGQDDSAYVVRQAMSEGYLERITVGEGESQTVRTYVAGGIVSTTTSVALHAENETRVFNLQMDSSRELTRDVVLSVGATYAGAGIQNEVRERVIGIWRCALGALEPNEVVIPYAPEIALKFPVDRVRARRDIKRTLNLIRACTILHQRSRERDDQDRLLSSIDDYKMVYPLLQKILGPTMSGWTEKALEIARVQKQLESEAPITNCWIPRSRLQERVDRESIASASTVAKWCARFVDTDVWEGRMVDGRWEHRTVRDLEEEPIGLPHPDELEPPMEYLLEGPDGPTGSEVGVGP